MSDLIKPKDCIIAEIQAKKEYLNKVKNSADEAIKNTPNYIVAQLAYKNVFEPEIIQLNNEIEQLEQKLKQHI